MRAKRDFAHWIRKAVSSQAVRDQIKRVLTNSEHKHFATVLKLVLPLAMVESIKAADGWTLKLPVVEEVVVANE